MSTPIFDALLAESDDTTRALVWDAVSNPAFDIARFMDEMNRLGRAYAQVGEVEPEPELQHPGTWLPGDQVRGRFLWTRTSLAWFTAEHGDSASDANIDRWLVQHAHIEALVPRTNGGN